MRTLRLSHPTDHVPPTQIREVVGERDERAHDVRRVGARTAEGYHGPTGVAPCERATATVPIRPPLLIVEEVRNVLGLPLARPAPGGRLLGPQFLEVEGLADRDERSGNLQVWHQRQQPRCVRQVPHETP